MLSNYLFTYGDLRRAVTRVAWWQWLALAGSVLLAVVFVSIFGVDLAILLAGMAAMGFARLPYRLPLGVAITGLVLLMAVSPFVAEDNNWERLSESIAIGVFFALVFAVFGMALDMWLDKDMDKKDNDAVMAKKSTHKQPAHGGEDIEDLLADFAQEHDGSKQKKAPAPRRPAVRTKTKVQHAPAKAARGGPLPHLRPNVMSGMMGGKAAPTKQPKVKKDVLPNMQPLGYGKAPLLGGGTQPKTKAAHKPKTTLRDKVLRTKTRGPKIGGA